MNNANDNNALQAAMAMLSGANDANVAVNERGNRISKALAEARKEQELNPPQEEKLPVFRSQEYGTDPNIEEGKVSPSSFTGNQPEKKVNPSHFVPGHDPRRHTGGAVTNEFRSFHKTIRQMLVEEGCKVSDYCNPQGKMRIQRVVERMYDEAELGNEKMIEMIMERTEGKITQPIEQIGNIPVLVIRGASTDALK
jgi:hypothetical protein